MLECFSWPSLLSERHLHLSQAAAASEYPEYGRMSHRCCFHKVDRTALDWSEGIGARGLLPSRRNRAPVAARTERTHPQTIGHSPSMVLADQLLDEKKIER
jgi:hypothetical protein